MRLCGGVGPDPGYRLHRARHAPRQDALRYVTRSVRRAQGEICAERQVPCSGGSKEQIQGPSRPMQGANQGPYSSGPRGRSKNIRGSCMGGSRGRSQDDPGPIHGWVHGRSRVSCAAPYPDPESTEAHLSPPLHFWQVGV